MIILRNRTYPSQASAQTNKYLAFLMPGTPPATAAELAAAVDMSDLSAIHAASVGNCMVNESAMWTKATPTGIYGGKLSYLQKDKYTQFKNGAMPLRADNTKWQYLPARIFRVDGRKMSGNRCTPSTFMAPMTRTNVYSPVVNMRDSITDPLSTVFQLEFDREVPVTGFYYYGNVTIPSVDPSAILLQYQDSNGNWQTAVNMTTGLSAVAAKNIGSTITAKNWRFTITVASANSLCVDLPGLALYGAADLPAIPVPDITWVILVPLFMESYKWTLPGSWKYDSVWQKHLSIFKYIPAIIDSAGDPSSGKPCVLSAATNLTTQSHPTFVSYTHNMGVLR